MCSMRIIDEHALTIMKKDLLEGYRQIMISVAEAAAGSVMGVQQDSSADGGARKIMLGEHGFIVEYSEPPSAMRDGIAVDQLQKME